MNKPLADDVELLRRYVAEASEVAFAELVRRRLDLVYAAALRRVGGEVPVAEEVTQHVFVALARNARALARRASLVGWLYTTTRFAAAQAVRTERRRRAREEEAEIMNRQTTEETAADWDRLRPVLDAAMDELKEAEREAVLLRFFAGQNYTEIGAKLSLGENTARMRVERALDKLQGLLAKQGVTSTAGALAVVLSSQTVTAAPAGLAASVTGAALAGGAAGAGMGAGVLAFMSATKIAMGVAGVVLLAALGSTLHQADAVRKSRAALLAARTERDGLRAKLVALETSAARVQSNRSTPARAVGEAVSEAAKATAPGAAPIANRLEYVLDHPEARSAFLKRAALTANARFERFFREQGLTGEQRDRFLKLAIDDAEGHLAVLALRRGAGNLGADGAPMSPTVMAQMSGLQKQYDAATMDGLKELLGDRFKSAVQYMNTMAERNVADQLASQLYYTDAPLSAQQAEQLTQVFAQNRYRPAASPTPANTMGGVLIPRESYNGAMAQAVIQDMPWMWTSPVTDAAVAGAESVLTPTQVAGLKLLQAEQAAELQLAPPKASRDGPAGKTGG